jgi:flagellar hook protein FlgE
MATSLVAGLSGLRANQKYIDVIGHNLANVNTDGFKSTRVVFADIYGQMVNPASAPSATTGGTNPAQIGTGVAIATIDQQMTQGTFRTTGRDMDLAIDGNGFFALESPSATLYSRVGTFGLDSAGDIVEQGSGYRVLSASGTTMNIPLDAVQAGQMTSSVTVRGNLPGEISGPFAEALASTVPWSEGTAAQVAGGNGQPFVLANAQTMQVRVDGGTAQTVTFNAADYVAIGAATAAEVAAAINAQTTGLTASVSAGALVIDSDRTGPQSTLDVDDGTGSPAATLGLGTALVRGTAATATAATQLNDLADNVLDYVAGDLINISGSEADGTSVAATFVYGAAGNGTSLGELRDFISSQYSSATATLDATGSLILTADDVGEASLTLSISDDSSGTGSTAFANHTFEVSQDGSDADRVQTAMQIFDPQGRAQTLQLAFERASANDWNMTASLSGDEGTFTDSVVQGIRFTSTGAFEAVTGAGTGDTNITIQWDDLGGTMQSVALDLGNGGGFDGLTQFGGDATAQAVIQDGYAAGSLESISVNRDGMVSGYFSNGRTQELDQIGLTNFVNPAGLNRVGETMFGRSEASGAATPGAAGTEGMGTILAGRLEQSNVDLAGEFVRLIEAQRGFQANARIISTTDEVLAELVQIV